MCRCNGFDAARAEFVDADVNAFLRQRSTPAGSFDAIVLDPPKFAPTAAHAERAARAYKDINRLALKLLAPGRAAVHVLAARAASAPICSTRSSPAPGIDAGVDGLLLERLAGAATTRRR